MSVFEGKTSEEAREEVSNDDISINQLSLIDILVWTHQVSKKFVSVYTIGFVYWPIAQTINFAWVKPRNQVIYVSFASLIWTTFLAYMKVTWDWLHFVIYLKPSLSAGSSTGRRQNHDVIDFLFSDKQRQQRNDFYLNLQAFKTRISTTMLNITFRPVIKNLIKQLSSRKENEIKTKKEESFCLRVSPFFFELTFLCPLALKGFDAKLLWSDTRVHL